MMKKLLLLMMLLPVLQLALAQDTIVKWTFPNNKLSDTVQNGTNPLNLTSTLRIEGAGPIAMKNGVADYAAQATNWDNGVNSKYWYISFLTTGYGQVQISSKQSAGGTNGGPVDFMIQYKIGSAEIWTNLTTDTVKLANNWTSGVISNLDLPAECQDQSDFVYIRWIMASDKDISLPAITAAGISKIDDIIVTGMPNTGINNKQFAGNLKSFPNPSSSSFSISTGKETTLLEIYNSNGQLVYKTIPDNELLTIDTSLPTGLYFVKAVTNGRVSIIKHIVR
jgi:hypothetical protein